MLSTRAVAIPPGCVSGSLDCWPIGGTVERFQWSELQLRLLVSGRGTSTTIAMPSNKHQNEIRLIVITCRSGTDANATNSFRRM